MIKLSNRAMRLRPVPNVRVIDYLRDVISARLPPSICIRVMAWPNVDLQ
jgi:hypothetical protein